MAKFVTFIADPDLESNVIKAIASIDGELALRGVSLSQIKEADARDFTLICTRDVGYSNSKIIVSPSMNVEEIAERLLPTAPKPTYHFTKGDAQVIAFVGLSGGVGTTSIAINYAFELSQELHVVLVDAVEQNPDIARALGLHRIEDRLEKVSKHLQVTQGQVPESICDAYVFDLGTDISHPVLSVADTIYVVTRISFNTLSRLRNLSVAPTALLFNFAERSKAQHRWRDEISNEFPRLSCCSIPSDRAFEMAAEKKSALMEVAGNSLARKSIATLG